MKNKQIEQGRRAQFFWLVKAKKNMSPINIQFVWQNLYSPLYYMVAKYGEHGRIRNHLTFDATAQLIHALITTHLDFCNSI